MRVKTLFANEARRDGGPKKSIVEKQNAVLAFMCFDTSELCSVLIEALAHLLGRNLYESTLGA